MGVDTDELGYKPDSGKNGTKGKKCSRCGEVKAFVLFGSPRKERPGSYPAWCLACKAVHAKERKSWTDPVRTEKRKRYARERRMEWRYRILDYLKGHCCVDCGVTDPRVLQFDHRDPASKEMEVSTLVCNGYSWERVRVEIEKCDVRCANCHSIRTFDQMGFWKFSGDTPLHEQYSCDPVMPHELVEGG